MNGQDFYNRLVSIKLRFNRLPQERQRKIVAKVNRKVNADFREVKDLWIVIKKGLKQ